jgi:hypothetical protein
MPCANGFVPDVGRFLPVHHVVEMVMEEIDRLSLSRPRRACSVPVAYESSDLYVARAKAAEREALEAQLQPSPGVRSRLIARPG